MIDFRYHVVSIVAVFLALATGLVLGASLLNAPLLESQNQQNDALIQDKEELRDQVQALQAERDRLDTVAQALGQLAVRDRLVGQQVVLVELPGARDGIGQDVIDGVRAGLSDSGSEVVGTVQIEAAWTDPGQASLLDNLAVSLTQDGIDLPDGTATDRAAVLLASALVEPEDENQTPPTDGGTDPGETTTATTEPPGGIDEDAATTILQGLSTGEFISFGDEGQPTGLADLAVVFAPTPPAEPTDQTAVTNAAWITIATALAANDSATVLTGPAAAAEVAGAIRALRDDGSASQEVSSADSAESTAGQAATVLALVAQLAGQVGHYGEVGDVDGPLPILAGSGED